MRKRRAASLIMAALPSAPVILAIACHASAPVPAPAPLDRGGTWGAEIQVNVVGPGRVTANLPGLDCPGDCFARFVFEDRTTDAAALGLTLTASSTMKDVIFEGWTFESIPLPARGLGSAFCNPLTRNAIAPPVDPALATIALPFGETDGKPPEGTEDLCSDVTAIPIAYAATAHFLGPTSFDANVPPDEVAYEPDSTGDLALEIGIPPATGRIYWHYRDSFGRDGIASGFIGQPVGGKPTIVVPPGDTIFLFTVDTNVVYETSTGLFVIEAGSTQPIFVSGGGCSAIASDAINVYCRVDFGTTSTLTSWPIGTFDPTATSYNLPPGTPFTVSPSYFYVVDDPGIVGLASIRRGLKGSADPDAAAPLPLTDLVLGLTGPNRIAVPLNSSVVFWMDGSIGPQRLVAYNNGTTTTLPTPSGFERFAFDPDASFTGRVWLGSNDGAARAGAISTAWLDGAFSTFRSTLVDGINGLAVDAVWVYWTGNDGRVRRARKDGF